MRFRRVLCRYGLVIICCATSLILSTLLCMHRCEPPAFDEQLLHLQFPQARSNGYRSEGKGWITNFLSRTMPKLKKATFLVVVIMSSPTNMAQRDTIRQTWLSGKWKDPNIMHFFTIGSGRLDEDDKNTLESENTRFGDLLLLPTVNDSYTTLTNKLLATLVWLDRNIDHRFLLKVDDDSFVKLDVIMRELDSVKHKQKLYWGYFNGKAQVKKYGKWLENDWVLCDYYLPYALGGGYVISSDLVHFVALNNQYLKMYFNEDVSLGTWIAPVDVHRIHDPRFDTEYKSRGCFNSYIITHKQSIEQMREKYWLLQERGKMCVEETKARNSYMYNWNVPPSKCCIRNDSSIP